MNRPASSVTFLYSEDFPAAKDFFTSLMGLEAVVDQEWAMIWRTGPTGFVGAVDVRKGSIPVRARGGVLVSFNVDDVDAWHAKMKRAGASQASQVSQASQASQASQVTQLTPIKHNAGIGLKSFFFKGPEGYDFEIQEFTRPEDRKVFLPS